MNAHGLVRWRGTSEHIQSSLADTEPPLFEERQHSFQAVRENPVQRTVRLLRAHFWIIVACILTCTFLSLLYSTSEPRLYRATSDIAIYRDSDTGPSLGKTFGLGGGDLDDYSVSLETQLRILQSRALALATVRKLGLDGNMDFLREARATIAKRAHAGTDQAGADITSAAVDVLLSGISVAPLKQTRVVTVSFTGPIPDLDAKIVNALVDGFIDDSIRSRYEAANRSAKFLSSQLSDLRSKVEDSQQRLVAYEREHNILGVDEKQNVVTSKLEELNKQLTEAEADRMNKQAIYQAIATGSLDQIPETKSSEAMQSLRLRESELKSEYAQTTTTFGPNHPKVIELSNRMKALDGSIQAELKRLVARAHGEYAAARAREQNLGEAFEAQKIEANHLNESAIQYGLLKRDFDSNRQLYDNLQERMKEAGVVAGLRSSNVRLIDAAEPPLFPSSPNFPKSGYIGLFLGLLASAAVIGIREGLDRALRNPADVESFTAIPSLAVIPQCRSPRAMLETPAGSEDVVCLTHPRSAMAEAYRALGTSILLASPDLKILLVTSSLPNEGKTISAANCAVILAQQGRRVLLVDADLRKPTMHRYFGMANQCGLSTILLGQVDAASAITPHQTVPNLAILPAGPAQPMPAEMLGALKMRQLMAAFREQYDYVIVDTPPVLAVTDAIRVSSQADSVLLILRSGQTTREALARSCDLLSQSKVPVLGIVVNAVDFRSTSSYYYRSYPELAKRYYTD
jgi:capsular exopolysaccharide synthesis family protein